MMTKKGIAAGLAIGAFLGLSDPSYALFSWMKPQGTEDIKVEESKKACKTQVQKMLQTDDDGKLPWGEQQQELSSKTWEQECIRAKSKDAPDPTQRNPNPYYQ